jgi:hypothetical protein
LNPLVLCSPDFLLVLMGHHLLLVLMGQQDRLGRFLLSARMILVNR